MQANQEDRTPEPEYGSGMPMGRLAIGAVAILFVVVVWLAYQQAAQDTGEGPVPTLAPENTTVRIAPSAEERGGMDIPYQDITLMNKWTRLGDEAATETGDIAAVGAGAETEENVEELLPPSETPLEMIELEQAEDTENTEDTSGAQTVEDSHDIVAEHATPPVPEVMTNGETSYGEMEDLLAVVEQETLPAEQTRQLPPPQQAVPQQPVRQTLREAKPESDAVTNDVNNAKIANDAAEASTEEESAEAKPTEEDVTTPAPTEPAAMEPPTPEPVAEITEPPKPVANFRVQVGALRDPAAAEKEWQRLQKAFPDVLKNLGVWIEKVDLGARGIFHRIQAGPLTREEATEVCDKMNEARAGGCIIVAR